MLAFPIDELPVKRSDSWQEGRGDIQLQEGNSSLLEKGESYSPKREKAKLSGSS